MHGIITEEYTCQICGKMHYTYANATEAALWNRTIVLDHGFSDELNGSKGNSTEMVMPQTLALGIILGSIALGAIFGNILIVLSVFTNRRLRTVTNCFVGSLATSDLLLGLFVMPLNIKVELTGEWRLGVVLCDLWVHCDVMLCTASILNLCCISLDRYFAITNPLVYVTRRSKRLACIMIAVVWVAAVAITVPPILGWQEEGRWTDDSECGLTSDPGYVIYSALGSFFIPLIIMIFVYARIFRVASQREKHLCQYRHSFKNPAGRRRGRFRERTSYSQAENLRMTVCVKEVDKEDVTCGSGDGEAEADDMLIKTSMAQQDQENSMRTARCVSVRRLHQGLVLSSALAMTDISRAHRQSLQQMKSATPSSNSSSSASTTPDVHSNSSCQKTGYFMRTEDKRRERAELLKERKTAKTLAIVVGCFVVCWLPFFLMYIISAFCAACDIHPGMNMFFTWLGYFNSLINPFIYALYNKDFRYSFWRLTLGHFQRKRGWREPSTMAALRSFAGT